MRDRSETYVELLVLRAQDGDQHAMGALVDHWHSQLSRHAVRLTGDREAASEAMQEAWLAIVRNLRHLNDPACFRPWSYRIVTNKCRDWIRHQARRRRSTHTLDHEPSSEDPPVIEQGDAATSLQAALAQLPVEQRTILSMFYLENMSIREISAAFSLPEGTVKSRLFHSRHHLKKVLERNKDE